MAALRDAVARWTLKRQGADHDGFVLHRRRLYIIPTPLGLVYALSLLAMLLGGLNYGSNPALLFTFLLAAAAWVAMHQAHANLAGLEGRIEGTALGSGADSAVEWHLLLRAPDGADRPAIEVDGPARPGLDPVPLTRIAAGQESHLVWIQPGTAGLCRIRLATRHPLGLFRAWTWLHPPPPRPASADAAGTRPHPIDDPDTRAASVDAEGDIVGLRLWRNGEPFRRIAWRASARAGRLVMLERAWPATGSEPRPRRRHVVPTDSGSANRLDRRALGLALLALGAASLTQLGRVPWLVGLALPLALWWRWLAGERGWNLPPRWARVLLALGAAMAILLAFRTWNGLAAGSALLTTMAALKLLETRDRRDLAVIFFLAAFLAYAAILGDASLPAVCLAVVVIWLGLGALAARTGAGGEAGHHPLLRQSGRLLLWSLPLAALLFLFVPRIDGHFWSLPADGRARSGLGDEMRPGDISELSLSDEPVMRVFFTGRLPAPRERYWRGPVLHEFDGATWRVTQGAAHPVAPLQSAGDRRLRYRVILEPTRHRYVPLLERAIDWSLPQAERHWDLGVSVGQPLTSVTAYDGTSDPDASVAGELSAGLRHRALQWPRGTNPQTLAWARRLRQLHADDGELVDAVLAQFRRAPFTYTLTPPRLDDFDAVDDFLFRTRRGFCGHYASALAAVARGAGIPARVVTGYQGGEWNRIGGYLLVRQSNAHAWVEVWLAERGWVRVDPTAAVAPERVERGLDAALGFDEPVPGRFYARWPWLTQARAWLDAGRTAWQVRFLRFDRDSQEQLAAWLGFGRDGLASIVRALVFTMALTGVLLLAVTLRGGLPRRRTPIERRWRRICREAARRGIRRHAGEGEATYAARVARECPALAAEMLAAGRELVAERYLGGNA